MSYKRVRAFKTQCCGQVELDGLSYEKSAKDALENAVRWFPVIKGHPVYWPSFIVFTGVTERKAGDHCLGFFNRGDKQDNFKKDYGQEFADYIVNNGYGEVSVTNQQINGVTNNGIKSWTWTVNKEKIKELALSLGVLIPDNSLHAKRSGGVQVNSGDSTYQKLCAYRDYLELRRFQYSLEDHMISVPEYITNDLNKYDHAIEKENGGIE